MEGVQPVTIEWMVEKLKQESPANLTCIWEALNRIDLNTLYSETNPDISMQDWAILVKSEMDSRGIL